MISKYKNIKLLVLIIPFIFTGCTSNGILTKPKVTTLPSGAFIVKTYGLKPSHGVLPKYLTYAAAEHAKSKGCSYISPVNLPMPNQFSKAFRCSKSGLYINDLLAAGSSD